MNTDFALDPWASKNPEGEEVEPLSIDVACIEDSAGKLIEAGVTEGEVDLDEVIVTEHVEQAGS